MLIFFMLIKLSSRGNVVLRYFIPGVSGDEMKVKAS